MRLTDALLRLIISWDTGIYTIKFEKEYSMYLYIVNFNFES